MAIQEGACVLKLSAPIQHAYTLDQAFDYCAHITNAHYENFPVASLFLPEERRPYIQAIYAFSRTADDFADELVRSQEDRLRDLNDWERQLHECYEGRADHPIFIALAETVRRLDIPKQLLLDLLTAFKRDVTQNRYGSFDDLLSYCRCSANPVGRLVLIIFGHRDEKLFTLSDHICTGLQLANFWQDVSVDRENDRLYIPLEDMHRFGYPSDRWKNGEMNDEFRDLLRFEVNRTRDLFIQGAELPSVVLKDLQIELRLVWFGGMAILKKIERMKYRTITNRPKLSTMDKVTILYQGLFKKDLIRFAEKQKPKDPWDLT